MQKDIHANYKSEKYAAKAISFLKKRGLLPLKASSELSSIVGHLIGDGTLSKDLYVGDFKFFGSKNKLERIKVKVTKLFSIQPAEFFQRKGGFVLRYNNCIISRVLELVGVPRGNKVLKEFTIPTWIKSGNKKIKKAFLVAIFDDELSTPRKNKRGYVESLRLKFNKAEDILCSGVEFLEDISRLLSNFGVVYGTIKLNNDLYINKCGITTRSIYFNISVKRENLLKFRDNVGFETELKKIDRLNSLLKDQQFYK
jgi:intein/homing endonuclease